MTDLTQERDVETLRQISLLLARENQRLITKTLQLTAELARVRGLPHPEQLALAELRALGQRRAELLAPPPDTVPATPSRPPQPGHGPRAQPTLPVVQVRHELSPDQRACPACSGELTEMTGQTEDSDRITTVKLTYQVEHHVRRSIGARATARWSRRQAPPRSSPAAGMRPHSASARRSRSTRIISRSNAKSG